MNKVTYTKFIAVLAALAFLSGCNKSKMYEIAVPPPQAHFLSETGTYYVTNDPNGVFKIPIGTTAVSGSDQTVSVSTASPTGAASGNQYTLLNNSVTIPAGKLTDTLRIKGNFSSYAGGRLDTLVLTLSSSDPAHPATYANTYKLVMQQYCNVVLPDLAGFYNNCFDLVDDDPTSLYGPYTINVTSGTVSGTKGFIMLENFWDVGNPAIRVDLDWTSADAFKTTIPDQFLYRDATYGNARVRSAGSGTFSSCSRTLTLKYEVYVSAGTFGISTTTIKR